LIPPNESLEEGEEDPNADPNQFASNILLVGNAVSHFNLDDRPSELLLNKYEKFPLYIEVVFQRPQSSTAEFYAGLKEYFTPANIHSISLIGESIRDQVMQ
jgi:hypothetical protein